jgi:hypothetical protein
MTMYREEELRSEKEGKGLRMDFTTPQVRRRG